MSLARWRRLALAGLVLLLGACATQAPMPPAPPPPVTGQAPAAATPAPALTRELVLGIDYARNIGTFVHRHERAAERASARLKADGRAAPADALGWVTEQVDGAGAVQVTYVAGPEEDEARWRAWARVVALPETRAPAAASALADDMAAMLPAGTELRSVDDGALSEFERDKLRARRTALRIDATDCATPTRVVVLSWRQQGRDIFLAYRLAAERGDGSVPWGGQHEFTLDARGRDLLRHRRSDATCSTLGPSDAAFVARTASRDTPSPFDVYTSLHAGRTLWLTTLGNGMQWRIDGDRVRVGTDPAAAPVAPAVTGAAPAQEDSR